MGKKRGLLAELQHQSQLADKRRRQQASAVYKAQTAAARQAEQARAQHARAMAAAGKATAAEQKAAEKEAKRLHEESMSADAEARNAELASIYDEIDTMLTATLEIDDFVDLERLRRVADHPAFPRPELTWPTPQPAALQARPEPQYVDPPGAPSGIGGLLGGKKKYAEVVAQAQAAFQTDHAAWQAEVADLPRRVHLQQLEYQQLEAQRQERLQQAQVQYEAECRQREADVQIENQGLDALIQGLAYGVDDAVQEYVSIVLGNSVYPDSFPVEHDFDFDAALRELTLVALVPAPSVIPAVREYKYVRAKDEISVTALGQKEQKDRYANAVAQVALRTLHEVFEADRAGRIQTIALTVATEGIDAATGLMARTPLVGVAADRSTFTSFDLSNVVPAATLQHLGAQLSKNPFGLVPIDASKGVRSR